MLKMKSYNILLMFAFALILLPIVSADSIGTFKQGSCATLIQTCSNCTFVNITSIAYPNSTFAVNTQTEMTKAGTSYNYTFCNISAIGNYIVSGYGDLDGTNEVWGFNFDVTYFGQSITTSQSIVYFIMFIILFFVFLMNMFFINKLPGSNAKDEEGRILSINYLKYLRFTLWFVEWMLFIGITYLASNLAFAYLGEQLFARAIYAIFQISFALTPVILIVWICWIFAKMFHDKQFHRMLNRGIFPQGKL